MPDCKTKATACFSRTPQTHTRHHQHPGTSLGAWQHPPEHAHAPRSAFRSPTVGHHHPAVPQQHHSGAARPAPQHHHRPPPDTAAHTQTARGIPLTHQQTGGPAGGCPVLYGRVGGARAPQRYFCRYLRSSRLRAQNSKKMPRRPFRWVHRLGTPCTQSPRTTDLGRGHFIWVSRAQNLTGGQKVTIPQQPCFSYV